MFIKLAFKNVGKSFKDYAVYFATLVFAVPSQSPKQEMLDAVVAVVTVIGSVMVNVNIVSHPLASVIVSE